MQKKNACSACIVIIIALKWSDCGAVVVFRQFWDFIVNFRYISLGASRLHNNLRYFIEICKCFLFFSYYIGATSFQWSHFIRFNMMTIALYHEHSNRIQIKITTWAKKPSTDIVHNILFSIRGLMQWRWIQ